MSHERSRKKKASIRVVFMHLPSTPNPNASFWVSLEPEKTIYVPALATWMKGEMLHCVQTKGE
jgi:uncharacterized membrane protein